MTIVLLMKYGVNPIFLLNYLEEGFPLYNSSFLLDLGLKHCSFFGEIEVPRQIIMLILREYLWFTS